MRYYEIVRVENYGFDMTDYDIVKHYVRRGWLRKATAYLAQWDYGGETAGSARVYGKIYPTPTDPQEPSDTILYQKDGYNLCRAERGGYEAYYLTAELPEDFES